jgi:hypothetical protein
VGNFSRRVLSSPLGGDLSGERRTREPEAVRCKAQVWKMPAKQYLQRYTTLKATKHRMRTVRVKATSAGGVLYVGAGGVLYLGSDEDIGGMRNYQQWTIIGFQGDRRMIYSGPSTLSSLHG